MLTSDERGEREHDHVRRNSSPSVNERIDRRTEASIASVAVLGSEAIQRRLIDLDREWDIERYLGTNAPVLAIGGVVLAAFHSRWWLILTAVVLLFMFQHAVQGWCILMAIFRHQGVRSRKEIDREKFALKALRGDFASIREPRQAMDAATT